MKKMIVLGILFVLLPFSGSLNGKPYDDNWQQYSNKSFGYTLSYPSGWIIKTDQEKNGYVSLFDKRALSIQDSSLELLVGIKIEIISNMSEYDYQTLLAETTPETRFLKDGKEINQEQIKQYSYQDQNSFIIIVPMEKDLETVIIAYIPEKNKKAAYTKQLDQILRRFKQNNSG